MIEYDERVLFVNQTKVEEMQEPESTNDTTNLKD